jgi:YkoY family integral membrane protein
MLTITIMIITLIFLEVMLSVDNAAVLAIMVKDLPKNQQPKALRYGLVGAYVFRGLCLFFAAYLVKIIWLKILGGAYLLYLTYSHFTPEKDSAEEGFDDSKSWVKWLKKKIGPFWGTVILVEIMDLAFSIDNVFAAVAMTDNLWVIMAGVAVGILAMRFVAQYFVILIDKYPSLNTSAFIVIALLGLKLIAGGIADYSPDSGMSKLLANHWTDFVFSSVMMLIFFLPLLKRRKEECLPSS